MTELLITTRESSGITIKHETRPDNTPADMHIHAPTGERVELSWVNYPDPRNYKVTMVSMYTPDLPLYRSYTPWPETERSYQVGTMSYTTYYAASTPFVRAETYLGDGQAQHSMCPHCREQVGEAAWTTGWEFCPLCGEEVEEFLPEQTHDHQRMIESEVDKQLDLTAQADATWGSE